MTTQTTYADNLKKFGSDIPARKATVKRDPKPVDVAAVKAAALLVAGIDVAKSAPRPHKQESSGAYIQRMLLNENNRLSDKQLVKIVLEHFPNRTTTTKDVSWNRWKLKQNGLIPCAPKKARQKAQPAKSNAKATKRSKTTTVKRTKKAKIVIASEL